MLYLLIFALVLDLYFIICALGYCALVCAENDEWLEQNGFTND